MRRPSLIALVAITVLIIGAALPAQASDPIGENGVMVILIDEGASPVQRDLDAVETIALTMARGTSAGTIVAASYGVESDEFLSSDSGSDGTRLVTDVIVSVQDLEAGPVRSDQFKVLANTFSFLSRIDATRGSRVALLTSGRILGESENTRERLRSVADLFAAEGWAIDVVALPSTEAVLRELMSGLATGSGGVFYDTGSALGFTTAFENYWQLNLDLTTAMDVEMHDNSAAVVTLDIAPHTDNFSTVFVRQHESVDVAVFSPNGMRAAADMESVEIHETPSAVIVQINSPVPGNWTLQGVGPASKLVAGVDVDNPLELRLIEQPPLPVGEPFVMEVAAFNGDSPQLLSSAVIEATINKANGSSVVVALKDEGENGDRFANDGIYSAQMSAPESQGLNNMSIELSWADYVSTMRNDAAYRTETFPTLSLVGVSDVETSAGEYATVARVQVLVGDYPFLISPSDIKAVLNGDGGQLRAMVTAVDQPEPGLGWEFDIAAVIPDSGAYAVEVVLDSVYQGRKYKRVAPMATTTALILEEPFLILGMPVFVIASLGLLLVLVGGFLIWVQQKTSPFGYIVDDSDQVIVDFAGLNRSVLRKLFSKNMVASYEASGLPFVGGMFKFSGRQVKLVHKRAVGDPSMRVDGRPAGPEFDLAENVWLGVGARLLTFRLARPLAESQAIEDKKEDLAGDTVDPSD
ncbi:MAG: hypothetical protein QGG20_05055 [Dehalococcoidia bacterium]|jgi:hypothetical protein|nr:hypothetical protein [Dehalococcoidia bacterium]